MPARHMPPRLGRPRRFDGDTERQLLMDAAIKVMTVDCYPEVVVADILAEAGVSACAFYRHFDSKEALFVAVMRRDAELVGQSLDRIVNDAADPARHWQRGSTNPSTSSTSRNVPVESCCTRRPEYAPHRASSPRTPSFGETS
jgi:AcrR family transcriptional regulator